MKIKNKMPAFAGILLSWSKILKNNDHEVNQDNEQEKEHMKRVLVIYRRFCRGHVTPHV
jgi:hypothetical protein